MVENPFERREQQLKTYISDSEDDDDKAETLALASMMLRPIESQEARRRVVQRARPKAAKNAPRPWPTTRT